MRQSGGVHMKNNSGFSQGISGLPTMVISAGNSLHQQPENQ
jgi:hypothetical protein